MPKRQSKFCQPPWKSNYDPAILRVMGDVGVPSNDRYVLRPIPQVRECWPLPQFCFERDRLLCEYAAVAREHAKLLTDQVFAVLAGGNGPSSRQLSEAEAKIKNAKNALFWHARKRSV